MEQRIAKVEEALARQALLDRRAAMAAVPANPNKEIRATTLKARRAARAEARRHFSIVAKEEGES
jgi:hypothetical protein